MSIMELLIQKGFYVKTTFDIKNKGRGIYNIWDVHVIASRQIFY